MKRPEILNAIRYSLQFASDQAWSSERLKPVLGYIEELEEKVIELEDEIYERS